MAISTLTFLALTGALVVFELGLMALAAVLLTRTLLTSKTSLTRHSALTNQPPPDTHR